jgi:hypothetical protein
VRSIRVAVTARSAAAWRCFGVDLRFSDLYPEMNQGTDCYVESEPLDASEPEQLWHAFELAGECTAIVTNTPHNTREASAVVENLIALVEDSTSNLSQRCSSRSGAESPGGCHRPPGRF